MFTALNTLLEGSSGQSFKEVNLGDIKNCLTLVVKVESLQSITIRQNMCH